MFLHRLFVIGMACLCLNSSWIVQAGDVGETKVENWKDGKKAAFLLFFDDNTPSQLKNAIPELKKRNLTGTFYVNPGKTPLWTAAWEKEASSPAVVLGNHTMNHKFVSDATEMEKEIKECNEALAKLRPDSQKPVLASFGKPGTNPPWKIPEDQIKAVLPKYNLIYRPAIVMASINLKTGKDMTNAVDKAIAKGEVGNILFHGVGGDWLSSSMQDYLQLLDYLVAKQSEIWVTDHISAHKYETERKTAEVKALRQDSKEMQLGLTCQSDPRLYDQPLTLTTLVPAAWRKCRVSQGTAQAVVPVVNGTVRYDAVPGAAPVTLKESD